MRAGKIIAIVLAAVIALPVLYLVYVSYAPHLLLNETTRYLYQYRDLNVRHDGPSLIPGLFHGGKPKDEVRSQLLDAGLELWNVAGDSVPAGAVSMHTFLLNAGARNIACGSQLFVVIGYDADDRLVSANVHQGGACL